MKLLVTGGAGFIGSNFIRYVLANYSTYSIVNFDKLTYAGNLENLTDVQNDSRYSFIRGDVCDRESVFSAVNSVDVVIHFAAESHVDRSILGPEEFIRTNVLGTYTILDAVKMYKKRLHHISTDEVFGTLGPKDQPFTERTPYQPRSPYSASKASADHLVRAYHETYGIAATISNCSNNYGPYMFPEKVIPLFITNLLEGKHVPVYGDGMQIRDWIFVDDHIRGIMKILEHGTIGETYCLGGGHEITNIELTKTLLSILGKDESCINFVTDRPGHDRRYAIDFSKATRELGWTPEVSFEEGIRRTVEWYITHQEWVARCKSGAYTKYYERQYGVHV